MRLRMSQWVRALWRRKWWFVGVVAYKVLEERILNWANGVIDSAVPTASEVAGRVLGNLPTVTWWLIPIVVCFILLRAYLDTRPDDRFTVPRVAVDRLLGKIHTTSNWVDTSWVRETDTFPLEDELDVPSSLVDQALHEMFAAGLISITQPGELDGVGGYRLTVQGFSEWGRRRQGG